MIKFFRNIRLRLLRENRFTRYLIYALGEIILVVIGILIALQINEWNNERNRKKWEETTLSQLRIDLEKAEIELEDTKKIYLEGAQAAAKLLRVFWNNDIKYTSDSLEYYSLRARATKVYSPPLGTAKALLNSGKLDQLEDSELKTAIISHVERVGYMLEDISRYEETYFRDGVKTIRREMPNSIKSLDELQREQNEQIASRKSSEWARYIDEIGIDYMPDSIKRVPFKSDVSSIFENPQIYAAYENLLVAHRNGFFKYDEILDSTNDLLDQINKVGSQSKLRSDD